MRLAEADWGSDEAGEATRRSVLPAILQHSGGQNAGAPGGKVRIIVTELRFNLPPSRG